MHSISDPSRVRFTGPLAPFSSALAEELATLGYASTSATTQLQLAAHLSRWLQARGLGPDGLTGPVIAERRQVLAEQAPGAKPIGHLTSLPHQSSCHVQPVRQDPVHYRRLARHRSRYRASRRA